LINISLLFAMPSSYDDSEIYQLAKQFQLSPWIHKRNPALCDYRLQFRPLPLTYALCAYGQNKEVDNQQMNPFKYG